MFLDRFITMEALEVLLVLLLLRAVFLNMLLVMEELVRMVLQ